MKLRIVIAAVQTNSRNDREARMVRSARFTCAS
jgi:hypothetical protein